jgi:hypoxanthine phosphoribosyltransferase
MSAREPQPAGVPSDVPPDLEILFDAAEVRDRVAELGRQIGSEIGAEDPLLVGLLEGSLIFLADLVRAIPAPIRFELIQVHSGEDSGVLRIEYPIPVDIAGQSVVVVKDVVASGVTEPYLEQRLRDHGARRVRFAALVDLPDERKTDFRPDYTAFSTSRRGVLVGYGLKHAGRYGNLSSVGRVRGTE